MSSRSASQLSAGLDIKSQIFHDRRNKVEFRFTSDRTSPASGCEATPRLRTSNVDQVCLCFLVSTTWMRRDLSVATACA